MTYLGVRKNTCLFQGNMAYIPQQAWIQNATLRDNITFGKNLQQMRYQRIIQGCALTKDIRLLPAGDLTEIGENVRECYF